MISSLSHFCIDISNYHVVEGKKGNVILRRRGQKAIILVNVPNSVANVLRRLNSLRLRLKVLKDAERYILAEVERVPIDKEVVETKVLERRLVSRKKYDVFYDRLEYRVTKVLVKRKILYVDGSSEIKEEVVTTDEEISEIEFSKKRANDIAVKTAEYLKREYSIQVNPELIAEYIELRVRRLDSERRREIVRKLFDKLWRFYLFYEFKGKSGYGDDYGDIDMGEESVDAILDALFLEMQNEELLEIPIDKRKYNGRFETYYERRDFTELPYMLSPFWYIASEFNTLEIMKVKVIAECRKRVKILHPSISCIKGYHEEEKHYVVEYIVEMPKTSIDKLEIKARLFEHNAPIGYRFDYGLCNTRIEIVEEKKLNSIEEFKEWIKSVEKLDEWKRELEKLEQFKKDKLLFHKIIEVPNTCIVIEEECEDGGGEFKLGDDMRWGSNGWSRSSRKCYRRICKAVDISISINLD